jgi:hypothetical protein
VRLPIIPAAGHILESAPGSGRLAIQFSKKKLCKFHGVIIGATGAQDKGLGQVLGIGPRDRRLIRAKGTRLLAKNKKGGR